MRKNFILLFIVILLIIAPLIWNGDAEFEGADGQAEDMITEISPDYEPWFNAIWEPPSGEVESLLFVVQAAGGALVIGYIFGVARGKRKGKSEA